jgi:hypothetical protein
MAAHHGRVSRAAEAPVAGRGLLGLAVILAAALLVAGCGSSLRVSTTLTLSTSGSSVTGTPRDVDALFATLAAGAEPMTIFGPTYLPEDAVLSEEWWPVIEQESPGEYAGPPVSNPQIIGSGGGSEIQVIFQTGDGWLAILENFRGDLGDVTGEVVGAVESNPASLYEVNGGALVQWSKDGLWYGVFGRGATQQDVEAVALGMRVRSTDDP